MALVEVKLRPTGPWRVGHRAGDRDRVDVIYHSDALYSAMTHAMSSLGWLGEWLDATARRSEGSLVRCSSLFPFVGRTRLAPPPRSAWPPAHAGKLHVEAAKLVPLDVIRGARIDESRWTVDGATGTMTPGGGQPPFEIVLRASAAIDRLTGVAAPHQTACLEFATNAGWWGVFEASAEWMPRVKSAFRLLADSGFGGERSQGWGRAAAPEFHDASSLFGKDTVEGAWWMLSLFSPSANDSIAWERCDYTTTTRAGWTDSTAGIAQKKQVRLIEEGSVIYAEKLVGCAVDVAPEGFAHPVYRAGFALAVALPAPVVLAPEPEPEPEVVPEPEPVLETVAEFAIEPEFSPEAENIMEPESSDDPETDEVQEPLFATHDRLWTDRDATGDTSMPSVVHPDDSPEVNPGEAQAEEADK